MKVGSQGRRVVLNAGGYETLIRFLMPPDPSGKDHIRTGPSWNAIAGVGMKEDEHTPNL